jgi:glycosyltransferase involved in cell wall biosynthesis
MRTVSQQTQRNPHKLSVAVLTYNHEKYIAQAIESVLMQEADFQVELVIGEDCSTDSTRTIVKQYAEQYPKVIRALLSEHNLGAQKIIAPCFQPASENILPILKVMTTGRMQAS